MVLLILYLYTKHLSPPRSDVKIAKLFHGHFWVCWCLDTILLLIDQLYHTKVINTSLFFRTRFAETIIVSVITEKARVAILTMLWLHLSFLIDKEVWLPRYGSPNLLLVTNLFCVHYFVVSLRDRLSLAL